MVGVTGLYAKHKWYAGHQNNDVVMYQYLSLTIPLIASFVVNIDPTMTHTKLTLGNAPNSKYTHSNTRPLQNEERGRGYEPTA